MSGWGLALRGIRHRVGRALILLALAAVAAAATVLAPLYGRAAQQSVVADMLARAPASAITLHVRSEPTGSRAPVLESTSEAKLEVRQLLGRGSLSGHLEPPIAGADLDVIATTAPGDEVLARLAYRDGFCQHLAVTAGQCPDQAGEVMLSDRSAREHGLAVGDSIGLRAPGSAAAPPDRVLSVSGIYTPREPAEPYWGRGGYFAAGPPVGESALPRIDAAFVADEQDLTLRGAYPSVHLDLRLLPGTVGVDDVERLRADLAAFETAINAAEIQLSTGLRVLLDDVADEVAALSRTIPVVAVPLMLVCWLVLFLLVAAVTEERGPELALAHLRGFSPPQAARFGRAESVLLVLLAVLPGVLIAVAVVALAAGTLLHPGVGAEARPAVLLAALLAAAVAVLVVWAGSARTLARPVLALLRQVPPRGSWRAGAAEAAVVALAAACLVAAVSDRRSPLALLAPPLLAVVAGITTARLLAAWSGRRVQRNARRGRLTGLLAHAQLARRGLGRRTVLVITLAVALLSFAATAWDVAAQARGDAAADTVGADRVLLVGAATPDALLAAVQQAAPDGTAMAVVRASERYDGGLVDVVGVGGDRLADVAVWRGVDHAQVQGLAARLRPDDAGADADVSTLAIPVALAGPTPSDDPEGTEFTFPGLGDTPQRFLVVQRYASLPRTGGRALLFDLDLAVRAARAGSGVSDNTRLRYEVWADDAAPPDLADRLAAAGLQLLGEESIAAERDRLARSAPALGLGLYLIAGATAVVLAVGSVLLTVYIGASTRRYELAALRVSGVPARLLRRGLLREYAYALGVAFVVGLAVGVAGAALMLPGVPLVSVDAPAGDIAYRPGPGALAVAVGATLAGLAGAVWAALGQVRRATPQRLREGV